MFTPQGYLAGKMDRIMLMSMWVCELSQKRKNIIVAGIGKPTFPIHYDIAQAYIDEWQKVAKHTDKAYLALESTELSPEAKRNKIVAEDAAIGYGHPQGDLPARAIAADALANWYDVAIKPDDILFTVGGAGALNAIFAMSREKCPTGKIVTPFPYYSLYAGPDGNNPLFPIDVMNEPGYKLTAESVQKSINALKLRNDKIAAFLFCDPNNPLGTVLNQAELKSLAKVLRAALAHEKDLPLHQKTPIILDEAYAEMRLDGKKPTSLLSVAPELADHIILMRSATKGLSAAGERMAVVCTLNRQFMAGLVEKTVNAYGHAPRTTQYVYAKTLQKLSSAQLQKMAAHYQPQMEIVYRRLHAMGAAMPDLMYKPKGTFYMLADLSDLLETRLDTETGSVFGHISRKIKTDEQICYDLLFRNGVMIAPLSYYGLNPKLGYVRITCSEGDTVLHTLLDILEQRLIEARREKKEILLSKLNKLCTKLKHFPHISRAQIAALEAEALKYQSNILEAKSLKKANQQLNKALNTAADLYQQAQTKAALRENIQSVTRRAQINRRELGAQNTVVKMK